MPAMAKKKNEFSFTLGDSDMGAAPAMYYPGKDEAPIDVLQPNSPHHKYVLEYLLDRIKASEDEMSKFYARWQVAERKVQAYMSLPNYEQMLRDMNNSSKPPAPAIILFPYKYAVISTIVTHCMQVFCGQKPFFPLGANSKEAADNVRYMQAMVQFHNDQTKMIMRLFQLLLDGELYGMGAVRCTWKTVYGKKRIIRPLSEAERMMYANNPQQMPSAVRDYEERVIFAGNSIENIDPFMFFPDPNVPMCEVSEKGEFVFWREWVGKHVLIRAQQEGLLKYVETVDPSQGSHHDSKWYNLSHRNVLTGGSSHAGDSMRNNNILRSNSYMVDQGSVEIIPNELGLGDSKKPEKWLFTILNKKQIVQAEPLDLDHNRHPVEVSEPYSLGYGFGQPALGDYIGPIQDFLSWLLDSHIYNVRASLNNQWLYDPSKINEKDLKYPQPGKHIRLRPEAYGTDARLAVHQFPVNDVTQNHMGDLSTFLKVGDMVAAVNDPMRGVTPEGGRRTATETRRVTDAAGSRLGVHAKLISQQAIVRIAEQMVKNIQQLQEEEIWLQVVGQEEFARIGPQLLMGDFTYTVHDGSLPLDKVASFELWKEILTGMAQSPLLMQTHSLPRIFENVCSLGGAPNITSYRLVSDAQMDQMAQAGNVIPLDQAAAQGGEAQRYLQ